MKQACITILLSMFMSMGGVMAYGQVQRTINVTTAGTLSDFISEDEKYQIEELTLTGKLNGDDIYLIRDMAGINMDKIEGFYYLGEECITDGKLRVLDLSGAKIVEGGREYYIDKMGSVSFSDPAYTKNDEISAYMFAYCHTLEELTLPSSATVISPFIFSGAKNKADKPQMNMKVIKVADGNTNYDSRDNCNAVIEKATSMFVVGCNGSTIPHGVTAIADKALLDCNKLESVTIPEGVTSIGNSAFSGCTGLTSVTIPNSVETIGIDAFYGCGNLASIVVGSGNSVFDSRDNCNAIIATSTNTLLLGCKKTTIPNGVTTIGGGAFSNCIGLERLTIPESVTTIGSNAFEGCTGLTSITIPNSVTEIAGSAFWKCTGLTSIIIPNSVTRIESGTFSMCSGLTSVTIPESVTSIGSNAFTGCIGLTSVTIPEGVTSIDNSAFRNCSNLATISFPNSLTTIESANGIDSYKPFYGTAWYDNQPDGLVYAGKVAYAYKGTMPEGTKIVFEEGTTGISGCFADNSGLTSVTIPSSVMTIGNSAFRCNNLTSVIVDICAPLAIDRYHFSNRENATLYVPKSCKESYESADYWKEFKEIIEDETLKGSPYRVDNKFTAGGVIYKVTSVDPLEVQVGSGDYSLTIFDYETAIDKSTEGAFTIPASVTGADGNNYAVTAIGDYAFKDCSGLTSVTIPNSVTSIHGNVFSGCNGLVSITVEETNPVYDSRGNCNAIIKTADSELISGCNNTIIPNSVTSIGGGAFSSCNGITSIDIPNSVTSIGAWGAFSYCSNLTSVIIPNSVTFIGDGAFFSCNGLTSVTVDREEPLAIEKNVFTNSANATLYVPKGCKAVYESANYWKDFKSIEEDETLKGSPYKVGDKFIFDGVTYKVTSIDPLEVQVGDGESWASSKETAAIDKSIEGAFEIPASVTAIDGNTYSVTSIARGAFISCSGLTSVTIPNSVTTIAGGFDFGGSAFVGGAFERCGLTSLTIPGSVTSIGDGAFSGCSNLISIIVEEGNTEYDSRDNCNAIIETSSNGLVAGCINTIIPDGVTRIGMCAFRNCKEMTSIEIPNSVTEISGYAFSGCSGLTSLTLPQNLTSIRVEAFSGCSGLTSIVIPEGVTWIGSYTFWNCSSMTSISIPASMKSIGRNETSGRFDNVFYGCSSLTSMTVHVKEPLAMGGSVSDIDANATLYVPKGCVDAYKAADYWKEFKNIVEYDVIDQDDVIEFADAKVKTICIANWDTNGDSELSKSEAAAVTDLGTVFKGQNEITSFNELEHFTGLTTIAGGTFAGCSSMTSVIIPSTVTSIGDGDFRDDKSGAFSNCSSLTSLTIPEGVTSIGAMAFSGCHSLTMMTIPQSVSYIGRNVFGAFNMCKNLIGLNILNLSKWCNVILPLGASPLYGLSLYVNGEEVKDLIIPDDVTYIAGSVFGGCKGLISVTIPSSVTEFGRAVFYDCNELTSVIVERAEPLQLDATEDFFYDRANATLYVPKGCVDAYKAADYWKEFKNIVEIGSVIRGDANGDGVISDADVIAVKDYIMGNEPENFVFEGADANEDGKVNVADIVEIVNKKK